MHLKFQLDLGPLHVRINWLILACVLITALTLGRLGLWQLSRAAEQVQAQEALQAELQENAPPIESLPDRSLSTANTNLQNRHVSLRGRYLNERTILVLAEFFNDQIGYGVVTPFRLDSNGELVLVNRGWTTGILPVDTPPYLGPVEGPVTITGQIHVPEPNARVIGSEIDASQWPLRVRSLEVDVISQILTEPVFPFEVRLTENQPGTLARYWPGVIIDVNQHLFYALQWFVFAIIVLLAALLGSSNLLQILRAD